MTPWEHVTRFDSRYDTVRKYVFTTASAIAEAVLYRYPDFETRTVICCSTQSGCPVGCRFCGTGNRFIRNLTPEEIVAQPKYLLAETGVPPEQMVRLQIMFMSMGEPLLNWGSVQSAIETLYADYPRADLLVSTVAPDVDFGPLLATSRRIPTVGLQFSVHETTDDARNALIPYRRKRTLRQIAEIGREWADVTGRAPFINYCVHTGNDTDADADRLATCFAPHTFKVTLSVICERTEGVSAAIARQLDTIARFREKLQRRGFDTRVFNPAGQDDIGGGCGQLWFVQKWMQQRKESHDET